MGSLDSDEYDDESGDNSRPTRRESGVSVASGIYEEIADGDAEHSTNHYENPSTLRWGRAADDRGNSPPPLPPRKQRHHFTDRCIHENAGREWCYRTPPMLAPHPRPGAAASSSLPDFARCLQPHRPVWGSDTVPQPEPDYLPMSPGPVRVVAEEQHYTVMASVNTT